MLSLFCYLQRLVTLDTNEFEMNMFKIQEVFPLKVGEKLITCIDLDLYCKMDVSIGQSENDLNENKIERKHD